MAASDQVCRLLAFFATVIVVGILLSPFGIIGALLAFDSMGTMGTTAPTAPTAPNLSNVCIRQL